MKVSPRWRVFPPKALYFLCCGELSAYHQLMIKGKFISWARLKEINDFINIDALFFNLWISGILKYFQITSSWGKKKSRFALLKYEQLCSTWMRLLCLPYTWMLCFAREDGNSKQIRLFCAVVFPDLPVCKLMFQDFVFHINISGICSGRASRKPPKLNLDSVSCVWTFTAQMEWCWSHFLNHILLECLELCSSLCDSEKP